MAEVVEQMLVQALVRQVSLEAFEAAILHWAGKVPSLLNVRWLKRVLGAARKRDRATPHLINAICCALDAACRAVSDRGEATEKHARTIRLHRWNFGCEHRPLRVTFANIPLEFGVIFCVLLTIFLSSWGMS
jgi:hypothetical protein